MASAGAIGKTLRLLSYNIQAAMGIDGVRSPDRIGTFIRELGIDIACLQEVEIGSPRSSFQNQPRRISEAAGMKEAFAHGFQRGPWRFGNCVLSRYPIRSGCRHALPSVGEPRSALVTEVEAPGFEPLHVISTHLGLNREVRVEQVKEIARIIAGLRGSLILMGDLNDYPDSPPLVELLTGTGLLDITGAAPTFPAPEPRAKIDYIFVRGLEAAGPSEVLKSTFSDHLPLLGIAGQLMA